MTVAPVVVMSIAMSNCAAKRSRALRGAPGSGSRCCTPRGHRLDPRVAHHRSRAARVAAARRAGQRAGDRQRPGNDGVGLHGSGVT